MADDNLYAAPEADVDVPEAGELAGRGTRLIAIILDGLIMSLLTYPTLYVMGQLSFDPEPNIGFASLMMDGLIGVVVALVAYLIINGYLLAKSGQSVGKRIMNIRIVSFDDDSLVPLPKLVGLRYAPFWLLSAVPLVNFFVGLENLFIFRSDRRCIHDMVAGTKVVKV